MKIGILTFHRSINNGAFMQAYALSNQIKRRFGDIVEIIDFEQQVKHESYKKSSLNKLVVYHGQYITKYKKFQKDLQLLPLSPQTIITNDYDEVLKYIQNRYDIVIVGSDAVWNYKKGLGLKNPYWLFGEELDVIKMSYAASAFGMDIKRVSAEEKEYISKSLDSFSYIGVRDEETKNFIQGINKNLEVNRNCDPTVLLDKPSIENSLSILKRYGIDTEKKIIGIMLSSNNYMNSIQKHLGRKQYQFIDIHRRHYSREKKYFSFNKGMFDLSPYEWHQVYPSIYLNFTNFFHGTLLGLKSAVPTFSFDPTLFDYKYVSKIRQLLGDLDLSDYVVNNTGYSKTEEERIISLIDSTIANHETIKNKIDIEMEKESQRANSFFDKLKSLL